ncbi:ferrochelatase [Varunaivibrio sulfuroxidans]|uniref:Ferrochelatase n=1 Tax=Varunaivibrio sulfuroxidans TaxID=1773489 RepID=A0A4R3JHN4_9PROT|nr:ferrochelatase [Varunaivibrio sulfuroxidans]TCS64863.1 ferrochelatase [Varunaivibrio sulfuroxidans]WES29839.1 ferrochelatase [Varunaivibrio sulfuroxidans]
MKKRAVVVFNLGGPDAPQSVQPFLFNLFNDPAIIALPNPLRWLVAKLIAKRRAPVARKIYAHMGGKSPLLELTREQAAALQSVLNDEDKNVQNLVFIAMRYWRPFSDETAREVKKFDPDEIVLLPLYPQFSTTTSGSSIRDWKKSAARIGLNAPTHAICCYPVDPGFIEAVGARIEDVLNRVRKASSGMKIRILFSAHGLPKKIIDGGDPYQWQVERTVKACLDVLNARGLDDFDHAICYQSRVGPMQWIGPSIEDEISRAAADGVAIVVTPIAFVSEHSETRVELDIEYRDFAERLGVLSYSRVDTVGTHPAFISGLRHLVFQGARCTQEICSGSCEESQYCPHSAIRCALSKS